ncbi:MAG: hypothetical protein WCB47_14910, partial [Pseudolabrys sp.]
RATNLKTYGCCAMVSDCWKLPMHYLAKVGVEGSNPFARSNFSTAIDKGSAVSSHVDAISV